jgi:hypothetical protein
MYSFYCSIRRAGCNILILVMKQILDILHTQIQNATSLFYSKLDISLMHAFHTLVKHSLSAFRNVTIKASVRRCNLRG